MKISEINSSNNSFEQVNPKDLSKRTPTFRSISHTVNKSLDKIATEKDDIGDIRDEFMPKGRRTSTHKTKILTSISKRINLNSTTKIININISNSNLLICRPTKVKDSPSNSISLALPINKCFYNIEKLVLIEKCALYVLEVLFFQLELKIIG